MDHVRQLHIYVIKPLSMVVVITAGNYNMSSAPLSGSDVLTDYILPAAGFAGMKFVKAE